MMCGESCGDDSILAVGEIRPSKDTALPLQLDENKSHKMSTKPRPVQLCQTSFDEIFFFWGLDEYLFF